MTGLCSSNSPRYFLDFAFYHYPCTTAGGHVVPEDTCRLVILYDRTMLFEYPSVLSRFCFLPLPMYHCCWTSCPRGYLSGSNFIPRYFLGFAFYHYPCTTAGGQVVPEGTCRVVILYDRTMLLEYFSVLSRLCFLPLSMYHCWWTSWFKQYLFDISNHKYTKYKSRIWQQDMYLM